MDDEGTVHNEGADDVQKLYMRELKALRGGAGLSVDSLRTKAPNVATALARDVHAQGQDRAPYEQLLVLIDEVSNARDREALKVAFGLQGKDTDLAEVELRERRRLWRESNHARERFGKVLRDERTVERWENAALQSLAWRLTETGRAPRNAGRQDSQIPSKPSAEYERMEAAAARLNILSERAIHRLGPGRVLEESLVFLEAEGRAAGAEEFVTRILYPTDRSPGVLHAETIYGCRIKQQALRSDGVLFLALAIGPLELWERGEFAFRIRVNSAEPMARRVFSQISRTSTPRKISLSVQFHESEMPRRVWWFATPYPDLDLEPSETDNDIPVEATGLAHKSWESNEVEVMAYYGIGWRWAD